MAARTLQVRCATWEQVEVFTTRKLRKGRLLSMKVPFSARVGSALTIGLELPNSLVIAIDGVVQKVAPVEQNGKADPNRTWIEIELTGFNDEIKQRLRAARAEDPDTDLKVAAIPPMRPSQQMAAQFELPADERALFQHLTGELRRLRQAAVHDVLGVARDAGPEVVRLAWKDLIRRHHPDLVAQRGAPAISHLAEELTILANRAYDRMRGALASGWLVGFEDLPSGANRFPRPATPPPPPIEPIPAAAMAGQGSDAFEARARAMLAHGDANTAREVLAAALVVYPRSKPLRSLYYVATALAALQDGEVILATAQLETALAHHDQCIEAAKMLEHIKRYGSADAASMRRLFR